MNFIKTPYLQLPETDGITVMWETDVESTSKLMVWDTSAPACGKVVYNPQGKAKVFSGEDGHMHKVKVTGLESGKDYCYQATSNTAETKVISEFLVFRTKSQKEGSFSLAVTSEFVNGVFGSDYFGYWYHMPQIGKIVESIAAERPDFLLLVGDMVSDGRNRGEWDQYMFAPFQELFGNTPFYHCAGNHEQHSDYMKLFLGTSEKGYYDFTYGCAHFIALDSTQLVEHIMDEEGNYVSISLTQELTEDNPQVRFLINSFKKSASKWKIVFFHYPPYIAASWQTAALRPLCRIFEEYDVDIVLNSHTIVYERSHPIRNDSIDYSKGVRYIVAGGAGAVPEWFHHKKAWHTAKSRAVPHFVHISVTPEHLELQAIDLEGKLFDSLVIQKPDR